MPTSSTCLNTPINGLYGRLWLLKNVPFHRRVLEPVHQYTIHTWNGGELRVTLAIQSYVVGWSLGVSWYKGYTHLRHKELNSLAFLPLNVLEKVIFIEQFHAKYIVIGIQAVNAEGVELEHVYSIVVIVGDGSAQFDIEGMLTNLSNIAQAELIDLLRSRYLS